MASVEPYRVLARRYRPQTFAEVVGQAPVVQTLKNALATGRVHHAYLFAGPRGVGKTTIARVLAKAINCADARAGEPCNVCDLCRGVSEGGDVDVIEIDGASYNKVENVRDLRENTRFVPARAPNKVYIVDEVHMLSAAAFNAFLKTLEEPPPRVKFLFATTEPHKVIRPVLSRCQRFDLRPVPDAEIEAHLARIAGAEGLHPEAGVLAEVARAADGSVRDALVLLDQVSAFCGSEITLDGVAACRGVVEEAEIDALFAAVRDAAGARVLETLARVFDAGNDPGQFLDQAAERARLLMVARVAGQDAGFYASDPARREGLARVAGAFSEETLLWLASAALEAKARIRITGHPRVVVELAFLRLARSGDLVPIADLVRRLEELPSATAAAPAPKAPASAPKAPIAMAAGPADLGRVVAAWPELVDAVGSFSGMALRRASPVAVDGDCVRVAFASGMDADIVQGARTEVEAALARLVGRRMTLVAEARPAAQLGAPAAAPPPTADLCRDPRVNLAVEVFGARIADVRDPPRGKG